MGRKSSQSPDISVPFPADMAEVAETSTPNGKAPRERKPKVYQLIGKANADSIPEILGEAATVGKLAKQWKTLKLFAGRHYSMVWVHRAYILPVEALDAINARPPRGPRAAKTP